MTQFQNQRFSVGSNGAEAQSRYRENYDHAMGKCGDDCPFCVSEVHPCDECSCEDGACCWAGEEEVELDLRAGIRRVIGKYWSPQ